MMLALTIGWITTAFLAWRSLRSLRRVQQRDRLREARIRRLETGFADLGLPCRLIEVDQLRRRPRHLRGLVAIPAVWAAHLVRPRTAAAVAALALGAGSMGPDVALERRTGRVATADERAGGLVERPAMEPIRLPTVGSTAAPLRTGAVAGAPEVRAAPPVGHFPPADEASPDPPPTVPPTTVPPVDLRLLEPGCVAQLVVPDIAEVGVACA